MKSFLQNLYFIGVLILPILTQAQTIDVSQIQKNRQVHIKKTTEKIKIDGVLNETVWSKSDKAQNFYNKFPTDKGHTQTKTEVQFTFDEHFLYIAATLYDVKEYIVQTMKRDQGLFSSDGFGVVIDPLNQHTNGFYFSVNPYNAQAEDLISGNGDDRLNFSWDNKWYSQTKMEKDKWMVEIAIPFKTLRYNTNQNTWGVNFIRSDKSRNEFHTWTNIPLNFRGFDIGYTGALIWDDEAPKPGSNISVIPYVTGSISQDKENNESIKGTGNAGFDAKIALTSSLNLDLTVNPDFSQVDVDRQVTNLTRFSIFFPERRNFFLENSDLFSAYGIPPIRPFYSRRIGLDNDGNTVPIIAGARISGNLNSKTRIGIMNIQTARKDDFAAQNYTAATVNVRVLKRSAVKAYYFNRSAALTTNEKISEPLNEFGRNAGIELNYSDINGIWQAWHGYHLSAKPTISKDAYYSNFGGGYFGRVFTTVVNVDLVGTNYYADMGFVQRIKNYDALRDTSIRVGYKSIYSQSEYRIVPKKGSINSHRFSLETFLVWNPDGSFNERNNDFNYNISFKNTSRLEFRFSNSESNLLFPAKFVGDDLATPIPAKKYNYSQFGVEYGTDNRKNIYGEINFSKGGFYNGTLHQIGTAITFRKQPNINATIRFEYNKLVFPGAHGSDKLFLIAPNIEWNFSTNLFWTTFLQYNTQNNNFNINSRLQWRYKPMSDLFLVYTDNYFTDPLFKNRNRGFIFKMNYWLNL